MMQSASNEFNGYQINSTDLVLSGNLTSTDIRDILTENLSGIVNLKLVNCNAPRVSFPGLKAKLGNVTQVKITNTQLYSHKLELLIPANVSHLTFKRCSVTNPSRSFLPLARLKKLVHIDADKMGLSVKVARYLEKIMPGAYQVPTLPPMPKFNDARLNDGGSGTKRGRPSLPPSPMGPVKRNGGFKRAGQFQGQPRGLGFEDM